MRPIDREASMKRVLTGVFATVLILAAGAVTLLHSAGLGAETSMR